MDAGYLEVFRSRRSGRRRARLLILVAIAAAVCAHQCSTCFTNAGLPPRLRVRRDVQVHMRVGEGFETMPMGPPITGKDVLELSPLPINEPGDIGSTLLFTIVVPFFVAIFLVFILFVVSPELLFGDDKEGYEKYKKAEAEYEAEQRGEIRKAKADSRRLRRQRRQKSRG
mmetsp:Transcript_52452/g.125329  ORF Transcript_52452/g.125329 Transcript_52452/m.125329 type:complete len:170 (-) Transcript_52452:84-593(-)